MAANERPHPDLSEAARRAWSATRVRVHPDPYRLVSLPVERLGDAAELVGRVGAPFAALVVEPAEVSVTLSDAHWAAEAHRFPDARADGPYRAITLDAELPLDLVGYLAPAADRLADANIAIVPQCGYRTDHLLVGADDLAAAVDVLDRLVQDCRA